MKIKQVRAMEGANFFSYQPVIRGVIDISDWQGKTTKELEGFNDRLLYSLPGLYSHFCSLGREGGFVERLKEGTLPGHVLEHVAIELLSMAAEQTRYGKTRLLDKKRSEYEVVYQYECKEAATAAFYKAVEAVNQLRENQIPDINSMVEDLQKIRKKYLPGPSTKTILDACRSRGIPIQQISGSLYQLGYGRFQRRIQAAMTDKTSCISVDIAGDKQLTRKILADSGIPVPHGKVVCSEEEILEIFRSWKQSLVVKPCNGNQGKGVSLDLNNEKEVLTAFRLAQDYDSRVIIEEYVSGRNFRLLVIGNKMAAAAEKIPPTVVGNGRASIKELVEEENRNPMRGDGHENYLTKISLDPVAIMDLFRQKMTVTSVPKAGQKVMLRQSANLSTGSSAIDLTDYVHPDNARLAVAAVKILGLDIAGVDLIMDDISRSWKNQNGRIIEVNSSPGLRMHLMTNEGTQNINIGRELVKTLFPQGNGRIPVISVTGTNGKTTTVRLISKILQKQNLIVGMTSTEGIYINDEMLIQGDLSGPQSARTVLAHKDVQVAVLETARGGILRSGLGYDYADVAIVTNISEDHLGQYGIDDIQDLTKVKSLVAEMVQKQSHVILNADDACVAAVAEKTKGRIIYFSTEAQNRTVCNYLALGGSAVVAERGKIMILNGPVSSFVCHLSKIPLTWGGKALHNVQNVLAAVAACHALGYSANQIKKAITGFGQDGMDNQGRLEYYDLNGVKAVLDYGHNPSGIKEIIKTLKQIRHRRIIACIGLPGDRSDDTVNKFAREAAAGFDFLYIKEDWDLRGRESGEVAALIYRQVIAAGFSKSKVKVVLKEEEAFREALREAKKGDIVVAFYEKAEPLREIINKSGNSNIGRDNGDDIEDCNIFLEVSE